jgi:hypothetical protein
MVVAAERDDTGPFDSEPSTDIIAFAVKPGEPLRDVGAAHADPEDLRDWLRDEEGVDVGEWTPIPDDVPRTVGATAAWLLDR